MADEVEILPPRPTTAVVVLAIVLLLLGLVLAAVAC